MFSWHESLMSRQRTACYSRRQSWKVVHSHGRNGPECLKYCGFLSTGLWCSWWLWHGHSRRTNDTSKMGRDGTQEMNLMIQEEPHARYSDILWPLYPLQFWTFNTYATTTCLQWHFDLVTGIPRCLRFDWLAKFPAPVQRQVPMVFPKKKCCPNFRLILRF